MHIFLEIRGHHLDEIAQIEGVILSCQEMIRKMTRKHAEEVDKLVLSDTLMSKLCQENLEIMDQLKKIKIRCDMKESI